MRAALFALALSLAPAGVLAQTPPADQTAPPATTQPALPPALDPPAARPGDPFGEEVVLPERQLLSVRGSANWDDGFEELKTAFKSVFEALPRLGLTAAGPPLAVYLRADDTGFDFEAGVPVTGTPTTAPQGDLALRPAPAGRSLRFTHRGAYDNMDSTYEALTNLLDDRRLEVKDMYMEEYLTDPLATPAENLHILIYVFPR